MLIFNEKKLKEAGGFLGSFAGARYAIFLMGFCAFYCGFIYNDMLSIPFDFFGTKWTDSNGHGSRLRTESYPFGFDPYWYTVDNDLVFFNSYKMKLSVIIGIIQMCCGLLFKCANTVFFRKPLDFFFEFIPQLVFMLALFGYMVIMIFIKWATEWNYNFDNEAPNLITTLMNMVLKVGGLDDQGPLWGDKDG